MKAKFNIAPVATNKTIFYLPSYCVRPNSLYVFWKSLRAANDQTFSLLNVKLQPQIAPSTYIARNSTESSRRERRRPPGDGSAASRSVPGRPPAAVVPPASQGDHRAGRAGVPAAIRSDPPAGRSPSLMAGLEPR